MNKNEQAEKILTISIAAYNMEQYIRQTLNSIVDKRIIDYLEVFVLDDGGTDHTLEIAKDYAEKYPNSIFPVHKENGGYGSTVNYSVKHASGKYFKLLDGDDWLDKDGLVKLVNTLKSKDVDVILSPHCYGKEPNCMTIAPIEWLTCNEIINISNIKKVGPLIMWMMTVKTQTLREKWKDLPEEIFYTDNLYVQQAFVASKTVLCLDYPVYCYRVAREGNTSSHESFAKHFNEYMHVAELCAQHYEMEKNGICSKILLVRAAQTYTSATKGIFFSPVSKGMLNSLKKYESKIKKISNDVYNESEKHWKTGKLLFVLRRTGYIFYWLLLPAKLIENKMRNKK